MPSFKIEIDGLAAALAEVGPEKEKLVMDCARMAINDTARWIVSKNGPIRRDMEANVNFPAGYLDRDDRFGISQFASNDDMEARITARFEATSLAQFVVGSDEDGLRVRVKTGGPSKGIDRSWIAGMKRGQVYRGNKAMLVRTPSHEAGDEPYGSYKPKKLTGSPGLWLVYGPSVYQVFRESMDRFEPMVGKQLADRFDKLLAVKKVK